MEHNPIDRAKKTRARKKRSERRNVKSDPEGAVQIKRNGPSRAVQSKIMKQLKRMYGEKYFEEMQ